MQLLDMAFASGRLCNVVSEIIKTITEEKEEKTLWEYWLHKDWERSWTEFRKTLNDHGTTKEAAPTQEEKIDIVKQTMNIMDSFCPFSEGDVNGTVQTSGENSG